MLSGDALEYSTEARKDDENVNRIKGPKTILDVLDDSDLQRMAELLETNYGKYYRYRNMWRRVLLWRATMWLRATYGLGDRAISRILNVPRGVVSDWVYNRCNPLGRHNIPVITPRLGYGVGAALGDGSANIKIRRLEFQALRDFDFAESIRDSLDGSWTRTNDNDGYYVYCSNKMLTELVALGKIDSQILLKILTIDEEVMKSPVRGFFDADGGTSNKDDGSASVEAKNTNLEIIKLVTTLLGQLLYFMLLESIPCLTLRPCRVDYWYGVLCCHVSRIL